MMKRALPFPIAGLIILVFSLPCFSQKIRPSVHVALGLASPSAGNVRGAFESGFGFALPLTQSLRASVEFGYWKSAVEENPGELYEGDLTQTPFFFELRYAFARGSRITPYASAGAGYMISQFKIGDIITIPEVSIKQEVTNGPLFHGALGMLGRISSSVGIFVEARYVFRSSTGKTTISDMNLGVRSESFSINLDTFLARVGLRYFFE